MEKRKAESKWKKAMMDLSPAIAAESFHLLKTKEWTSEVERDIRI
jgi:hypothetical protein